MNISIERDIPNLFRPRSTASAAVPARRQTLVIWSVRRELWENRSIYIAPMAVAAVALFAFLMSAVVGIWRKGAEARSGAIARSAGPAVRPRSQSDDAHRYRCECYCVIALHSEQDVIGASCMEVAAVSDFTTVLAKVEHFDDDLPLIIFAITIAMQWLMLLFSSVILLARGQSVVALWMRIDFRADVISVCRLLTAHALSPCRLLLVAPGVRMVAAQTLLWATLPLVAVAAVELIVFRTWHFATLVGSRLIGAAPVFAFGPDEMFPSGPMTHIHALEGS